MNATRRRGVTLLEALLSVAMLAMIVAAALPLLRAPAVEDARAGRSERRVALALFADALVRDPIRFGLPNIPESEAVVPWPTELASHEALRSLELDPVAVSILRSTDPKVAHGWILFRMADVTVLRWTRVEPTVEPTGDPTADPIAKPRASADRPSLPRNDEPRLIVAHAPPPSSVRRHPRQRRGRGSLASADDRASTASQARSRRAFTLLELLVALAITAAVVVAATAWTSAAVRSVEAATSRPSHEPMLESLRRLIEDDLRLGDSGTKDESLDALAGEDDGVVDRTAALTASPAAEGNLARATDPPGAGLATSAPAASERLSQQPGQPPVEQHGEQLPGRRIDMVEGFAGRLRVRTRSRDHDLPGPVIRDYTLEQSSGRLLVRERRPSGSVRTRAVLEQTAAWRCELHQDLGLLVVWLEFDDGQRAELRFVVP